MSPVPAAPYQKRWVMLLQLVAVGAGLVLGIVIRPEAVTTLLFSAVLQLVATVIGWRGIGGPVAYAGAVALVVLGAAADPALRELLYVGGFPYAHLGLALATQALVSRVRTVTGLIVGVVLLAAAVAALAAATTAQGAPISTALLASSVPVLVGGLIATSSQLRRARRDRVSQGGEMIAPSMPPEAGRAASSLLTVALLSESLGDEASDARTAVWSEQVRRIALRGLGAEPRGDAERLQVQLEIRAERDHADEALADATKADASPRGTATEPDGTDVTGAPGGAHEPNDPGEPPSELTDREREIVRLLRTGASNAAIARDLYLSEATIKGHVSRLMRRHDCGNRTQLALLATRWSL